LNVFHLSELHLIMQIPVTFQGFLTSSKNTDLTCR
jgi:hypothetical protein